MLPEGAALPLLLERDLLHCWILCRGMLQQLLVGFQFRHLA
jgi:hypothetical protein